MILLIILAVIFLAVVLAGIWYESSPWRWCEGCQKFWNVETRQKNNYTFELQDKTIKRKVCAECKQKET